MTEELDNPFSVPFSVLEEHVKKKDSEEKAQQALARARCQLIVRKDAGSVFFATLALRLKCEASWETDTMSTDGKGLRYNPDYVNSLPTNQLIGVVGHEVMHNAMQHHTRIGHRDIKTWNLACVLPGTRILMADGSERPIENILPGDRIIGVEGHRLVDGEVLASICKRTTDLVHIHHDWESSITTSGDHKFLTERGYVDARELCEWPNKARLVFRIRKPVRPREPSDDDDCRHGQGVGTELPQRGCLPVPPRALLPTEDGEAANARTFTPAEQGGGGIHCRSGGWGGDDHDWVSWRHEAAAHVPATDAAHHQYQPGAPGLVDREGVRQYITPQQLPPLQGLLVDRLERKCGARRADVVSPPAGGEEATSCPRDGVHHLAVGAAAPGATNSQDGGYRAGDQEIELAAISAGRHEVQPHIVYDLSTTCHSFIANGFVVHNCDLAINPILLKAGFELPPDRAEPGKGKFSKMPPDLSAEEYYQLLMDEKCKQPEGDEGEDEGEKGDDPGRCGGVRSPGDGSEADKRESQAEWEVAAAQAKQVAQQRGTLPAGIGRMVEEMLTPRVDWKEVLREFISRIAKNDYSWSPPNKRYVHLGIYLPGLRSEELGDVIVAVDTSGSISGPTLTRFASELQGILDGYDVSLTILYHDAAIQHTQHWKSSDGPLILEPKGGGGTSHCPVFEWVAAQGDEPACLVALTDMCSVFPEKGPSYPVLWAVVGNPGAVAPFGQAVQVE